MVERKRLIRRIRRDAGLTCIFLSAARAVVVQEDTSDVTHLTKRLKTRPTAAVIVMPLDREQDLSHRQTRRRMHLFRSQKAYRRVCRSAEL